MGGCYSSKQNQNAKAQSSLQDGNSQLKKEGQNNMVYEVKQQQQQQLQQEDNKVSEQVKVQKRTQINSNNDNIGNSEIKIDIINDYKSPPHKNQEQNQQQQQILDNMAKYKEMCHQLSRLAMNDEEQDESHVIPALKRMNKRANVNHSQSAQRQKKSRTFSPKKAFRSSQNFIKEVVPTYQDYNLYKADAIEEDGNKDDAIIEQIYGINEQNDGIIEQQDMVIEEIKQPDSGKKKVVEDENNQYIAGNELKCSFPKIKSVNVFMEDMQNDKEGNRENEGDESESSYIIGQSQFKEDSIFQDRNKEMRSSNQFGQHFSSTQLRNSNNVLRNSSHMLTYSPQIKRYSNEIELRGGKQMIIKRDSNDKFKKNSSGLLKTKSPKNSIKSPKNSNKIQQQSKFSSHPKTPYLDNEV